MIYYSSPVHFRGLCIYSCFKADRLLLFESVLRINEYTYVDHLSNKSTQLSVMKYERTKSSCSKVTSDRVGDGVVVGVIRELKT